MDDTACAQEEKGFEKGVRHQMKRSRAHAAHADGRDHVSQLADRRISEYFFNVERGEGDERSDTSRCGSNDGDNLCRIWERLKEREKPCDHVNARRDHGCRVNERTDRRGALHGVRKPNVQRELRRFSNGTTKKE